MSSSYVEVREAENGTDENALPIAIDTCESNGIVSMSQIEGEPQKDHTYNKEPLEVQGEVEVLVSSEEVEDMEVSITSPEKTKWATKQKNSSPKKSNKVARSPIKKRSPKKSLSSPRKKAVTKEKEEKSKAIKKEEKEESKVVPNSEDKVDDLLSEKDSLAKKRGQKRRAESPAKTTEKEPKVKKEKLDVKKNNKVVKPKNMKKEEGETKEEEEQTENDTPQAEDDAKIDVKETEEKPSSKPPSKKNLKTPKKITSPEHETSSKDDSKLPEGWTRKVVQRKSGKTAGHFDVYIYSPDGKKLRSKPDVATYLAKINSPLTVDDFNFSVRPASATQSSPPTKKSTPTPAKAKLTAKSTSVSNKKKTSVNNSKKGMRLVVKLNFSPKKRILSNYEQQEKTAKLGTAEKSEGAKKTTLKKTPAKKQKAQAKKKTPTKQTPSKK